MAEKTMTISVVETILTPDDAEVWIAPSGRPVGIRIADGRVLRPRIVYELRGPDQDGEDECDVGYDELLALGVLQDIDLVTEVEEVAAA